MNTNPQRFRTIAAWLLRFDAIAHILAAVVVFLPNNTIVSFHELLLPGTFPDSPVAWYLARGLPAYYAMHGALVLYVSFDVERYTPLIRVAMRLFAAYGLLMLIVDVRAPMPKLWTIAEPVFILSFSATVLLLLATQDTQRA